jgi:hypothetical protein
MPTILETYPETANLKFFTPYECAQVVAEFDAGEKKAEGTEVSNPYFYRSFGIPNLSTTLAHKHFVTAYIQTLYPDAVFCNTYTRSSHNTSKLGIHTDRKPLYVTLSVCMEDSDNLRWPLYISKKEWVSATDVLWDPTTDSLNMDWQKEFTTHVFDTGEGGVIEGRRYPHWRDPLRCGEDQRVVFTFFTFTKKD